MAPIPPLFTLPMAGSKGSNVVATRPAARVYLLTFNHAPDNRLTPAFLSTFMLALDILEYRFPKGVVVTTSAIPKFYSNGLDFENAVKTKGFFERMLYPFWRRLLTYVDYLSALLLQNEIAPAYSTSIFCTFRSSILVMFHARLQMKSSCT